jgi:D-alanine-D-alanine ligase
VLGCAGWGRVDLIVNEHNQFYFLEANTSPGMTKSLIVQVGSIRTTLKNLVLVQLLLANSMLLQKHQVERS